MFKPVKCGLVAMAVLSALTVRAESLPGGSVAALLELARQQGYVGEKEVRAARAVGGVGEPIDLAVVTA